MPYIKQEDKIRIDEHLGDLSHFLSNSEVSSGEVNYLITRILIVLAEKKLNYENINRLVGVLECAKLEMYRRLAAPYEDSKISENGDVYFPKE